MAAQAGNHSISPHVISGVFVQQYYHILHESPDQVHKFYQDASILGRQDTNGTMVSVTTLQDINEKIMSMDFRNCLTEIETADAQPSHKDGVLIVVTGSLTSSEGICRKFTQTFFLAPQESGGYFVLNDVLRFIAERPPAEINHVVIQENEDSQNAKPASETETTPVDEGPISDHVAVGNSATEEQNSNPAVNDSTVENNASVKPPLQVAKEDANMALVAHHPPPAAPTQTDVTKKSYASIVKVMKEGPPTPPVAKPSPSTAKTNPAPKPVTKAVEAQILTSAKLTQATATEAASIDKKAVENNSPRNEQGYSIFVKGLPYNATVQMVEEEFKKFGVIKPGGIQVRNRADGFCFGFIEYESQQSMQAAIEASPVRMGEKEVCVEEKRTTTRVVNGVIVTRGENGGGGRFQSGRGVYRGDNFRGRGGGYMNNASYRGSDNFNGSNDGGNFNRRNDGRGRGPPPGNGYHHNGGGFHPPRPFQKGNGRFTRVNGPKQSPVAA
ncbi:hypothetical protein QOZ80_1BG0096960 [Eleusine coracana subsp. coracana]|nr:hypothetical protein QOZ80_1BG0096960 [Eleusine coracana subsp. coracana]